MQTSTTDNWEVDETKLIKTIEFVPLLVVEKDNKLLMLNNMDVNE